MRKTFARDAIAAGLHRGQAMNAHHASTRGMRVRKHFARIMMVLLAGTTFDAKAEYVFNVFVYPDASDTVLWGLNDAGVMAGDATVGDSIVSFVATGAPDGNGGTLFSFYNLPATVDGQFIFASAINNDGEIVGTATPLDGASSSGFILTGFPGSSPSYSYFAYPGRTYTMVRGISPNGEVTGGAYDVDADGAAINPVGFIYYPARTPPAFDTVTFADAGSVLVQGMNASRAAVGNELLLTGGSKGFLRDGDGNVSFVTPITTTDRPRVRARGINDNGQIAGFTFDPSLGVQVTFIGNDQSGYQYIKAGPPTLYLETGAEAINNSGQIAGYVLLTEGEHQHAMIACDAALPVATQNGSYDFDVSVTADVPTYIDPPPALGFDYATGAGDPMVTAVRLPIGVGDSQYTLIVQQQTYAVAGGSLFDFRDHGFAQGVSAFRVVDIEPGANVDPANPAAFPTQLTFADNGRFTGTMTPLCTSIPERAHAPHKAILASLKPCG